MRAMRKAVFSSRLWHYATSMPFLRCALAAGGRAQTGWSAEGFETDASLFRHLNERLQISPGTLHKHLAWLNGICTLGIRSLSKCSFGNIISVTISHIVRWLFPTPTSHAASVCIIARRIVFPFM